MVVKIRTIDLGAAAPAPVPGSSPGRGDFQKVNFVINCLLPNVKSAVNVILASCPVMEEGTNI